MMDGSALAPCSRQHKPIIEEASGDIGAQILVFFNSYHHLPVQAGAAGLFG
jgi:hypothetical protein